MSPYDPEQHHRRSIRLPDYDYRQDGMYFVTLCTVKKALLFGEVIDGVMVLNDAGRIIETCWLAIPTHFDHAILDAFVIMPNHVHGIVMIDNASGVGARHASPLRHTATPKSQPKGVTSGSLGAIVGSFKSASTRLINQQRGTPGYTLWQRNYYEHIIRNDANLSAIRLYISTNPAQWEQDSENNRTTW